VDNEYDEIGKLTFVNRWVSGAVGNFSNSSAWSCNAVPDGNTDVIIESDTVFIDSDVNIRSITLLNNGYAKVLAGFSLTLNGKKVNTIDFNLSSSDLDFLDSISAPIPPFISFRRSTSVISKKNLLLSTMLEKINALCTEKTNRTYSSDTGSVDLLTYNGIAYSFGSNQVESAALPESGDDLHRSYSVNGIDCSGLMVYLINHAGIQMPDAGSVEFENVLRTKLNSSSPTPYPQIRILNLANLKEEETKRGDYIVWYVKRHIGILENTGAGFQKTILQSNGNQSPLTLQGKLPSGVKRTPHEEQFTNWGATRGINPKSFSKAIKPSPNWDKKYNILRLYEFYNMNNTQAFTTNLFTCVGIGKGGYIWAGTPQQGLYRFDGTSWIKSTALTTHTINDIKTDKDSSIWIAQSGGPASNGNTNINGGVNYFINPSDVNTYYGTTAGLPSRNTRSIFIDTTRFNNGNLPMVWSGHMGNNTGGIASSGGVGKGLNATSPFFNTIRTGLELTNGLGAVNILGGSKFEIWAFAPNNFGRNQILIYDAASGAQIGSADFNNAGSAYLPSNFNCRAIFIDKRNTKWIGMLSGGITYKDGAWGKIEFPELFTATTAINNNAITGNDKGEIFIGTTTGLIIYNGTGPINDLKSYKKLSIEQGLPSNNIRGICYDENLKRLILATDAGVAIIEY